MSYKHSSFASSALTTISIFIMLTAGFVIGLKGQTVPPSKCMSVSTFCPGRGWVKSACDDPSPCGSSSGNVSSTAPPDPFQLSLARFDSLLLRLSTFQQFRRPDNSAPRNLDELSRQVDDIYTAVDHILATLNFDNDRYIKDIGDYRTILQTLLERERTLQARQATLPAEIRAAGERLKDALKRAELEENRVARIEAIADKMKERSDIAALESMQWLRVASSRQVEGLSEELVARRKTASRYPLNQPVEPVNIQAQRPAAPIVALRPPGWKKPPPGPVDDRINATEAMIPRLEVAVADNIRIGRELVKARSDSGKVQARVDALESSVGGGEASRAAVEKLAQKAESRVSQAAMNRYQAGANAAAAIAEDYILESFRDNVVKPEVMRFLRANGITRKINKSLIVQMYQAGKSLVPSGARVQSLNRLLDAEKRAINVIEDYKTYALAAAASAASPTDTRGMAIAAEISAGTNEAGEEIIKLGAGESGPVYEIIRAIMKRK